MSYATKADLVLILHLCFIGFVLFGQALIMSGTLFRWNWVRNPWFRGLHLLAILFVVFEAFMNIRCPLTTWEVDYRLLDGQDFDTLRSGEKIPEISYPLFVLRGLLFSTSTPTVYTTIYVTFALLVILFFYLNPPHWRRRIPKTDVASSRNGQRTRTDQPVAQAVPQPPQ